MLVGVVSTELHDNDYRIVNVKGIQMLRFRVLALRESKTSAVDNKC